MLVVSAFPGCGKSTMTKQFPQISDSDSSQFDKSQFPQNYLDHIQDRVRRGLCTFVSSHDTVRKAMVENYVPFTLVYPRMDCKDEYIKRYIDRAGTGGLNKNNEEWFADLMAKNWEDWIAQCQQQGSCIHRELKPGQFLVDVVEFRDGRFWLK